MAGSLSSLIGHVDDSIEQRASLLAALRAKLDTGDAETPHHLQPQQPHLAREPATAAFADGQPPLLMLAEETLQHDHAPSAPTLAPVIDVDAEDASSASREEEPSLPATEPEASVGGDSFIDVLAQLDRGLDQRQQLIDALKAQLSKSAALPKSGSACTPAQAPSAQAPKHLAPPVQPFNRVPQVPRALHNPTGAEPQAKRFKAAGPAPGLPLPWKAPEQQDSAAKDAGLAALAARKAEMLRSLSAAGETAGPEQTGPGESQAPLGGGPPPMPQAVPEPPPGTSPEEFEAYRQQCWKQYYDWCTVWQKYYGQSQQQKGKGAGGKGVGGKGAGKVSLVSSGASGGPCPAGAAPSAASAMLQQALQQGPGGPGSNPGQLQALQALAHGKGGSASGLPGMGNMPAMTGKGRANPGGFPGIQHQAPRATVEEDIHSKLLGL